MAGDLNNPAARSAESGTPARRRLVDTSRPAANPENKPKVGVTAKAILAVTAKAAPGAVGSSTSPADGKQAAVAERSGKAVATPTTAQTVAKTNSTPAEATKRAAPAPQDRAWRMPPVRWVEQAMLLEPVGAKAKRRRSFLFRIGLFVVAPTLLMVLYVYWYATPRYVSELQLTYQSNDPSASTASTGLLTSILGGASSSSTDMSQVLQAFLTSSAVAEQLDKELHLRQRFSAPNIDWLDRLVPNASVEKFLIYFNRRVSVYRQLGGYVTVDAEAFDPIFAQKLGNALVKVADSMVATMMARVRDDSVKLAAGELKRTEERLRKSTVTLTTFRNQHSDVNIQISAVAVSTVVSSLEAQLSQTSSDLANAKTFLAENAPSIIAFNARIAALKKQIEIERKRLGYSDSAGNPASGGSPYSQIVAEYAALQTEQQFATDSYVSAKKAYDAARAMAQQKSGYIVSFVPPGLPQTSTAPDPFTYILSAFLISLLAYMIGSLLVGAFKDKAGG